MPSHRAVTFAAHDDDDVLKTLPEEKAGAYNDEEVLIIKNFANKVES